mmetsp:Transcript_89353/g.238970  ORF Transcript_89353/g.238970 Transcript_89353/m.238970 type:complete len:243 (+) Transcript_89353:270-998(+)
MCERRADTPGRVCGEDCEAPLLGARVVVVVVVVGAVAARLAEHAVHDALDGWVDGVEVHAGELVLGRGRVARRGLGAPRLGVAARRRHRVVGCGVVVLQRRRRAREPPVGRGGNGLGDHGGRNGGFVVVGFGGSGQDLGDRGIRGDAVELRGCVRERRGLGRRVGERVLRAEESGSRSGRAVVIEVGHSEPTTISATAIKNSSRRGTIRVKNVIKFVACNGFWDIATKYTGAIWAGNRFTRA